MLPTGPLASHLYLATIIRQKQWEFAHNLICKMCCAIWLQVTWLVITAVRSKSFGLVTERRNYNARHIFHHQVWYHALSLCYACIWSSGIILIAYATFVPNFISIAASIAELAHGEKLHSQSITHSVTPLIWCPGNQGMVRIMVWVWVKVRFRPEICRLWMHDFEMCSALCKVHRFMNCIQQK